MPKALKANYIQNIKILKINLSRGMDARAANNAIDGMERQFIAASLYGPEEHQFINAMRAAVIEHFTKIIVKLEV